MGCINPSGSPIGTLKGFGNLLLVMISHLSSIAVSQVLVRKHQSGNGEGDDVAYKPDWRVTGAGCPSELGEEVILRDCC